MTNRFSHLVLVLAVFLMSIVFQGLSIEPVSALNAFIDPNGDGSTGAWNSTAATYSTEVDEATRQPAVPNTLDNNTAAANNGGSINYRMSTIAGATSVTQVTVWVYHNDGSNGEILVQLYDDNETTTRSSQIALTQSNGNAWHQVTFSVSLTQNELNTLTVRLTANKNGGGGPATITVHAVYADVTYSSVTTSYDQSGFRFYQSLNSPDVGAPLAGQNSSAVLNASGDDFRLRLLLHISDAGLGLSGENFKLQFVGRGTGSCSSPIGGTPSVYTDVTTTTLIAYNNLSGGVSDGDALTTNTNDPGHSGHTVRAQSVEESNNFSNAQSSIGVGEDGMWDFALRDNGAPTATAYCFRVVKSDNSTLNNYSVYPTITTGNGVLSVDIVDSVGLSVANPSFALSSIGYVFICDNTTGMIGENDQRIRLTNNTANPSWSLTIAATAGSTASWSDGGIESYDFNDLGGAPSGCSDSADADSVAGLLSLDPSVAAVGPRAGCTSAGISLGSSSSFDEGVNDSISIASSNSSTPVSCYWDFTGIDSTQQIPSDQAAGNYSINLTLTATAI